ncbi:MAG: DUF1501 domain-containing protein [Planctomycetota bacterium]
MAFSRRELLRHAIFTAPAIYLGPQLVLRTAFGSAWSGPKNLVFIELQGGNDGINTIVPYGKDSGMYYTIYRPTIGIPESSLLKVNSEIGFHPSLSALKSHFDAGRVAVIQGCCYPNPNFSHDVAAGILDTGTPSNPYNAGWVARHISLQSPGAFPLGVEASSSQVDGILDGSGTLIPAIRSVSEFVLPFDSKYSADKTNRRIAYEAMAQGMSAAPGSGGQMANTSLDLLGLVDTFKTIPAYAATGAYPSNSSLSKALKLVAQLLKANLGARYFHVGYGGFDTHSEQDKNSYHSNLLLTLSNAIDAFYTDLTALQMMDDTLIVVYTEFGRTVYENGSEGTDHGTISPILVIGNSVNGGLTTPHPSMHVSNLTNHKQPPMVVDFRDVWCTILAQWLGGSPAQVFPGYSYSNLGFLN